MRKTTSKSRIMLHNNRVMTLGEAIDAGLVKLRAVEVWNRKSDTPKKTIQYLATEVATGNSWDIGKMLYESRMG
mgnify:CR=1 FL=1